MSTFTLPKETSEKSTKVLTVPPELATRYAGLNDSYTQLKRSVDAVKKELDAAKSELLAIIPAGATAKSTIGLFEHTHKFAGRFINNELLLAAIPDAKTLYGEDRYNDGIVLVKTPGK